MHQMAVKMRPLDIIGISRENLVASLEVCVHVKQTTSV